jgi:uncharacterized membrane protein YpjA
MRWLLFALLLVNALGFFYGMVSYWPQLQGRSVFEWFLIADCPVSVFLFVSILLLLAFGKRVPGLLADFTFVYLIKSAFVTLLIFLLYFQSYDISFSIIASAAHVFMVLQSFLLLPFLSRKPHSLLFLFLLDFSDFFLGTLYYIPSSKYLSVLFYSSLIVNFALFFFKQRLAKIIKH